MWLNGLECQVSTQLVPQFDIDMLLSQDSNEQESNVQQMFRKFFPESSGADVGHKQCDEWVLALCL